MLLAKLCALPSIGDRIAWQVTNRMPSEFIMFFGFHETRFSAPFLGLEESPQPLIARITCIAVKKVNEFQVVHLDTKRSFFLKFPCGSCG